VNRTAVIAPLVIIGSMGAPFAIPATSETDSQAEDPWIQIPFRARNWNDIDSMLLELDGDHFLFDGEFNLFDAGSPGQTRPG